MKVKLERGSFEIFKYRVRARVINLAINDDDWRLSYDSNDLVGKPAPLSACYAHQNVNRDLGESRRARPS